LRPGLARVHLDEQFDKIPKHYIRCLADRGITPAHQEWMASRYEIKSMQDLDTGHMPAYAAPDKLADALAEIVTVECA
jgi:pimeloyl-ACP methyl ester carboxylesterase